MFQKSYLRVFQNISDGRISLRGLQCLHILFLNVCFNLISKAKLVTYKLERNKGAFGALEKGEGKVSLVI